MNKKLNVSWKKESILGYFSKKLIFQHGTSLITAFLSDSSLETPKTSGMIFITAFIQFKSAKKMTIFIQ